MWLYQSSSLSALYERFSFKKKYVNVSMCVGSCAMVHMQRSEDNSQESFLLPWVLLRFNMGHQGWQQECRSSKAPFSTEPSLFSLQAASLHVVFMQCKPTLTMAKPCLCSAPPPWCVTFSVLNLYILSWKKKKLIQALACFQTEIFELSLSSCFSPWYIF